MLRRIACVCWLVLLAMVSVAAAQEFSADVFSTKSGNVGLKKLYSSKSKVRLEVESSNSPMGPSALIFDDAQGTYTVIMAQRHMYMDAPTVMTRSLMDKLWRVQDVNDACPGWRKAAEQARANENWGSCTKVGSDTVNGRSAVKYEGVSKKGDKSTVWVDTKLHCVVKLEDSSGTFELRNIQEGSQPASLFEVPADYKKFDMGSMMQRPQ